MPSIATRPALTAPPLGWNSFDSYGCSANQQVVREGIEAFARRLRPHGYAYFVIDNGWFGEYEIAEGETFTRELHAKDVRLDAFGRLLPSKVSFPDGFDPLVSQARRHGIKLGLHLMRGVPRKAVELRLPVEGTSVTAADIADVDDTCPWCDYMYGVDMDRQGASDYYDSVFRLFASWGIDFVKVDDVIHKPREIEAVADAIDRCGRDIVLSLSPGGQMNPELLPVYRRADLFRVTSDVWDRREDLDKGFDRWGAVAGLDLDGVWPDLDMIPFGRLMRWNPPGPGRDSCDLLAGVGFERDDRFTSAQRRTFITQRALAASPLFFGGDLVETSDEVMSMLTHPDVLACNQNGVVGQRVYRDGSIEAWLTPHRVAPGSFWLGVFNRGDNTWQGALRWSDLSVSTPPSACRDIWLDASTPASTSLRLRLDADDVAFLHCTA
ncbi:MAG: glycoside hydrolase family 27 protein [Planctomycetota bacterium]